MSRMKEHAALFEPHKAVRTLDSVTSHEAAYSAESVAGRHHAKILEILRQAGVPLAAEQIGDGAPEIDKVAVGKRMVELERGGLVERTELRYVNRSGRGALKWRLKP